MYHKIISPDASKTNFQFFKKYKNVHIYSPFNEVSTYLYVTFFERLIEIKDQFMVRSCHM